MLSDLFVLVCCGLVWSGLVWSDLDWTWTLDWIGLGEYVTDGSNRKREVVFGKMSKRDVKVANVSERVSQPLRTLTIGVGKFLKKKKI